MSKPIEVTAEMFEQEVLKSELPVVVDFYASWCAPCKMLAPIVDKLAVEFDGRVKFVKVNVEEEFLLADQYGIHGVPTLVLLRGGIVVDTLVGLVSPHVFRGKLEELAAMPKLQGASSNG